MRRRNPPGFRYLLSLLFVFFLTIAGTSFLIRSVSELDVSQRFGNQSAALHVADAGVDQAARNLRTPTDLTDDVTSATLPTGVFTIDTPVSLGGDRWRVVTHGSSVNEPHRKRNVEAVFQLVPQSLFQYALFGDQQISVSGNAVTDSYDSGSGPYDDDTAGHNGDVGTNSTSLGGVAVGGSIFVDGQVAVGPNVADPDSVVSGYDRSE